MTATKPIVFRADARERADLEQRAEAEARTLSDYIRNALSVYARARDGAVAEHVDHYEITAGGGVTVGQSVEIAESAEQHEPSAPINVDAIVNDQLADAEANGLTVAAIEQAEQAEMPVAGVKAIRRPPVPFSPTNQPKWIPQ